MAQLEGVIEAACHVVVHALRTRWSDDDARYILAYGDGRCMKLDQRSCKVILTHFGTEVLSDVMDQYHGTIIRAQPDGISAVILGVDPGGTKGNLHICVRAVGFIEPQLLRVRIADPQFSGIPTTVQTTEPAWLPLQIMKIGSVENDLLDRTHAVISLFVTPAKDVATEAYSCNLPRQTYVAHGRGVLHFASDGLEPNNPMHLLELTMVLKRTLYLYKDPSVRRHLERCRRRMLLFHLFGLTAALGHSRNLDKNELRGRRVLERLGLLHHFGSLEKLRKTMEAMRSCSEDRDRAMATAVEASRQLLQHGKQVLSQMGMEGGTMLIATLEALDDLERYNDDLVTESIDRFYTSASLGLYLNYTVHTGGVKCGCGGCTAVLEPRDLFKGTLGTCHGCGAVPICSVCDKTQAEALCTGCRTDRAEEQRRTLAEELESRTAKESALREEIEKLKASHDQSIRLLHGEHAGKKATEELRKEVQSLKKKNKALMTTQAEAHKEAELEGLRAKVERLTVAEEGKEAELERLRAKVERLTVAEEGKEANVQSLQAEVERLRGVVAERDATLRSQTDALAEAEAEVARVQAQYVKLKAFRKPPEPLPKSLPKDPVKLAAIEGEIEHLFKQAHAKPRNYTSRTIHEKKGVPLELLLAGKGPITEILFHGSRNPYDPLTEEEAAAARGYLEAAVGLRGGFKVEGELVVRV